MKCGNSKTDNKKKKPSIHPRAYILWPTMFRENSLKRFREKLFCLPRIKLHNSLYNMTRLTLWGAEILLRKLIGVKIRWKIRIHYTMSVCKSSVRLPPFTHWYWHSKWAKPNSVHLFYVCFSLYCIYACVCGMVSCASSMEQYYKIQWWRRW